MAIVTLDRVQGCILGLALGDAFGAPWEGGFLERLLWRWIGRTQRGERRWTDDTQMALDVAETFLETGRVDPDDLALRFARSYRWDRGYGPGAAKVLKQISAGVPWQEASRAVYSSGSFGNGAAMRAPMVGLLFANRPVELLQAARATAAITHAHPLGIEGATLMALATAELLRGSDRPRILDTISDCLSHEKWRPRFDTAREWLETGSTVMSTTVVQQLGNGVGAHQSCVTALYIALRFLEQPFVELMEFVTRCGGDADTIGSMAGALWGAANGRARLPAELLQLLEQHDRLLDVASALHRDLYRTGDGRSAPPPIG